MADDVYDPFANNAAPPPAPDTSEGEIELKVDEAPDSSREHALATGFDDPSSLISEISANATPSLAQETVEAVQELVFPTSTEIPEANFTSNMNHATAPVGDLNIGLAVDTSVWHANKAEMAEQLFNLVLSEYKFEVLVEKILQIFVKAVDCEAGSILEVDHKSKEFFFRASMGGGDKNAVKAFRVPCNKGIVGHVAESRASILINDLEDNAMQLKSISMATGFETKSCIAVPIFIANQLYGVIEVFNRKGIMYFDANDVKLLEEGVQMAGKVLEVRFFLATLWRERHKKEAA